jgi:hypothetical protein
MSYSSDGVGTAYIDVETLTTTTVTRRVKTGLGAVVWHVKNYTEANVTVCLTDFEPHRRVAPPLVSEAIRWPLPDGNCTKSLAPGHTGIIIGLFTGTPGDVYDYVIKVNGSPTTDPQLEI